MQIGKKQIQSYRTQFDRLKNRVGQAKEQLKEGTTRIVRTGEVALACTAFSVAYGYHDEINVVGVPIDLGAAVGLHVAGLLMVNDKDSAHLNNFGDGALASFLSRTGREYGREWRRKGSFLEAAKSKLGTSAGKRAVGGKSGSTEGDYDFSYLSDEELADALVY